MLEAASPSSSALSRGVSTFPPIYLYLYCLRLPSTDQIIVFTLLLNLHPRPHPYSYCTVSALCLRRQLVYNNSRRVGCVWYTRDDIGIAARCRMDTDYLRVPAP